MYQIDRLSQNDFVASSAVEALTRQFHGMTAITDLGLSYTGISNNSMQALTKTWTMLPNLQRLRYVLRCM